MAYVLDPTLTDEENKKREEQQNLINGAPGGAPGATPDGGIAGGVPPVGGQPTGTSGSSGTFTNLQRYLSENGPQSLDLAKQVAGNVTATGQDAQTAAQGVVAAGQQAIDAARIKPTGVVDEAATNPTSVTSDPTKKAEFLKERDASYTGPAGLEDVSGYQDAQAKVKAAEDKVALTGSEAGRTTLLKNMGGPGYGQGKADLNQLLLSGNPDAAGIVSSAAEPYKNLTSYLSTNSDAERAAAVAAAQEAQGTAAGVKSKFTGEGGVIPTAISELDKRVADSRKATGEQWAALTDKLNNLQPLTDQDLALLGISKDEAAQLYETGGALKKDYSNPLPLSGYLNTTGSPDMITRENLATDEDYARQLALAELMGPQAGLLGADTRAQAGTAQTDLGDFNQETIPAGPYQGITFTGTTAKPVADTMVKLKALDTQTGQTLSDSALIAGAAKLKGINPPVIPTAQLATFQDVINRNVFPPNPNSGQTDPVSILPLNVVQMRNLRDAYGLKFPGLDGQPGIPQPQPPTPPPTPGPIISNPPGGDVGH